MNDTTMTKKSDPKYDDDLVNKRYVDKLTDNLNKNIHDVIESGSNTKGTYIKYGDGTLICRKAVAKTVNITTAWGNLYEGHMDLGDSPYTFIDTNYQISLSPTNGSGILIEQVGVNRTASNFGSATLVRPGSTSNTNAKVDLIAIGRWK